MGIIIAIKPST